LNFSFGKGECLIETGFFFFNTEAHPVDGASLECCRLLRSGVDSPEGPDLLQSLDLSKLLNKHIRTLSGDSRNGQDESLVKEKPDDELRKANERSFFANLCSRLGNDTVHRDFILSTMGEYYQTRNPFTCTTYDSFELQMSFINSQSYFP